MKKFQYFIYGMICSISLTPIVATALGVMSNPERIFPSSYIACIIVTDALIVACIYPWVLRNPRLGVYIPTAWFFLVAFIWRLMDQSPYYISMNDGINACLMTGLSLAFLFVLVRGCWLLSSNLRERIVFGLLFVLGAVVSGFIMLAATAINTLLDTRAVIIVCTAALIALILLSEKRANETVNLSVHSLRDAKVDVIEALSLKMHLTPREREVFNLLAQGRNADRIARKLLIGRNTVVTHIKSIYVKLDVHSQQELLDSIEEYQFEQRAKID